MIQFKLKSQIKKIMQKKFTMTVLAITLIAVMVIGMQIESVDAKKSKGTYNPQFGSATKHIVCGDRLCSDTDIQKQSSTVTTKSVNSKTTTNTCSNYAIQMESNCSSFNISGAVVKSSTFDESSGSTIIQIQATDDGKLTINASSSILDTIFVLVDGEESDDIFINGSRITIEFFAGTETIEIFGN